MGFVTAAYLVVAALFALYALTLTARQRVIAELADAAMADAAAREEASRGASSGGAASADPAPR